MALKDTLLSKYNTEKNAFTTRRTRAKDNLDHLELPTLKNEEWKFTSVRSFDSKGYKFCESQLSVDQIESVEIPDLDAYKIFLVNGVFNSNLSKLPQQNQVLVCSISDYLDKGGDVSMVNERFKDDQDFFGALNSALFKDGYLVKIERSTKLDKPVVVYNINDASQPVVSITRNIILVEENACVSVIESYHSIGSSSSLSNVATEIFVGVSANVNYYKLQNEVDTASHIGTSEVVIKDKAVFTAFTFSFDGEIIRNNLNLTLDGEHIEANMYGAYLLNGTTHVDNHTIADHLKPNCVSNELYKGVLDEKARGVFNGKVFVRPDAQKTNAFQSNKNVLLTDDAKINAKPQLEIWADDVSCSHGCTVGQLDENAIFFLRQRGISEEGAKKLLLNAFVIEVVEFVNIDAVKVYLRKIIDVKL
jgi:Fe-S cluster assembly protein SufD